MRSAAVGCLILAARSSNESGSSNRKIWWVCTRLEMHTVSSLKTLLLCRLLSQTNLLDEKESAPDECDGTIAAFRLDGLRFSCAVPVELRAPVHRNSFCIRNTQSNLTNTTRTSCSVLLLAASKLFADTISIFLFSTPRRSL